MKKKVLGIVMSVALTVGMTAGCLCTVHAGETEDHKIGFLAPTLQTEFFISIDDGLKKECEDRGWEYVSVSFDNDSAKAVTNIENMVTGSCDAIIAMVSDSSCDAALKAAQDEGVKIMECGVETDIHDVVLNTDQHAVGMEIGKMASDWINNQLDGAGKVVVYTTVQNQDMQNRGEGIQEALKENAPDAEILEVVDIGKDVVGSGTTTTENMLQKYPDLNTIVCYGDAAAVESMEAAKAAGVDSENFGIFSCDGTAQALAGIANGDPQKGSVMFAPLAPMMAEYCQKLFDGETFEDVVETECIPVTAENVTEFYNPENTEKQSGSFVKKTVLSVKTDSTDFERKQI